MRVSFGNFLFRLFFVFICVGKGEVTYGWVFFSSAAQNISLKVGMGMRIVCHLGVRHLMQGEKKKRTKE